MKNFNASFLTPSFPDIKIITHKKCTKSTSHASHSCKLRRDIDQELQNKAGNSGRMCLNDVANLTTTTTSEQGEPQTWVLTKRTEKPQLLVTDDAPVELEKRPFEAQECRNISSMVLGRSQHVTGWGLETRGFWPMMPKHHRPRHCLLTYRLVQTLVSYTHIWSTSKVQKVRESVTALGSRPLFIQGSSCLENIDQFVHKHAHWQSLPAHFWCHSLQTCIYFICIYI